MELIFDISYIFLLSSTFYCIFYICYFQCNNYI